MYALGDRSRCPHARATRSSRRDAEIARGGNAAFRDKAPSNWRRNTGIPLARINRAPGGNNPERALLRRSPTRFSGQSRALLSGSAGAFLVVSPAPASLAFADSWFAVVWSVARTLAPAAHSRPPVARASSLLVRAKLPYKRTRPKGFGLRKRIACAYFNLRKPFFIARQYLPPSRHRPSVQAC